MRIMIVVFLSVFICSCMSTQKVALENGKWLPMPVYKELLTAKERVRVTYFECDTQKTLVGFPEKVEIEAMRLKSNDLVYEIPYQKVISLKTKGEDHFFKTYGISLLTCTLLGTAGGDSFLGPIGGAVKGFVFGLVFSLIPAFIASTGYDSEFKITNSIPHNSQELALIQSETNTAELPLLFSWSNQLQPNNEGLSKYNLNGLKNVQVFQRNSCFILKSQTDSSSDKIKFLSAEKVMKLKKMIFLFELNSTYKLDNPESDFLKQLSLFEYKNESGKQIQNGLLNGLQDENNPIAKVFGFSIEKDKNILLFTYSNKTLNKTIEVNDKKLASYQNAMKK